IEIVAHDRDRSDGDNYLLNDQFGCGNLFFFKQKTAYEMYFKKISPRTTCLYSAASMLLRSASAACQSLASKPRFAPVSFAEDCFCVRTFAIKRSKRSSCRGILPRIH